MRHFYWLLTNVSGKDMTKSGTHTNDEQASNIVDVTSQMRRVEDVIK